MDRDKDKERYIEQRQIYKYNVKVTDYYMLQSTKCYKVLYMLQSTKCYKVLTIDRQIEIYRIEIDI